MILEFSEFIRAKYPYIIIATLVVAIFVGFYTASPGKFLKNYSIWFVIVMIASMGYTITARSFFMALKDITGFSTGMFLNFVLSPILCYAISLFIPNLRLRRG